MVIPRIGGDPTCQPSMRCSPQWALTRFGLSPPYHRRHTAPHAQCGTSCAVRTPWQTRSVRIALRFTPRRLRRADESMRIGRVILLVAGVVCPASADTIKFVPKAGVSTFAVREPVLRVKPGDIVESSTFSQPGDYYEKAGGPWPGEVGPFYI